MVADFKMVSQNSPLNWTFLLQRYQKKCKWYCNLRSCILLENAEIIQENLQHFISFGWIRVIHSNKCDTLVFFRKSIPRLHRWYSVVQSKLWKNLPDIWIRPHLILAGNIFVLTCAYIRVTLFYKKSKVKMGNVIFPFLRP